MAALITDRVCPAASIHVVSVKAFPVEGSMGTAVVVPENGPGPIEFTKRRRTRTWRCC